MCLWRCLRYALWVIENHNYRCVSLTLPQVRTVGHREPQLQVCVSDAASGTYCGWSRTTNTGVCLWRCLRYALWVIENHKYRCVSLTLPQVRTVGDREPQIQVCVSDAASGTHCGSSRTTTWTTSGTWRRTRHLSSREERCRSTTTASCASARSRSSPTRSGWRRRPPTTTCRPSTTATRSHVSARRQDLHRISSVERRGGVVRESSVRAFESRPIRDVRLCFWATQFTTNCPRLLG